MMKQHKWHKEIKAWADGAEIEARYNYSGTDDRKSFWTKWEEMNSTCRFSEDDWWEYRIKPQPIEPQYLYVYGYLENQNISFEKSIGMPYIGKIKLEVDDAD